MQGLCNLSAKMLRERTRAGGCYVRVRNETGFGRAIILRNSSHLLWPASPKLWLQTLLQGRDLWTDSQSELSKASFSKKIFLSMGAWSMQTPGYVHLEKRTRAGGDTRYADKDVFGNKHTHGLSFPSKVDTVMKSLTSLPWDNF